MTQKALRIACIALLFATSFGWKAGNQKGGKDSPQAVAKHHEHAAKHQQTQYRMPADAFVQIFALPSTEAKTAQHRLGELLASSCKTYNRVGECKMYSAKTNTHHIRLLKFTDDNSSSVVAYMLQENNSEIEKALDKCVPDGKKDVMSHENGGDYRCYEEQAVSVPSVAEVLELVKDQLKDGGMYELLSKAPHKSIFLTSDPKAIIFQESKRLSRDNKDQDFFTQKLRDSFRPIIEWLAWQYQQYSQMAKGTPMLYCHAEELDNNEHAEVNRVLEFMGIAPQAHAPKKVVTATLGEENYQRQKLRNDIANLPSALSADIDDFLQETLQEKQLVERYVSTDFGNRTALWPPKNVLHNIALDNTLLVTAVTCEYAPLVVNWLKWLHDTQFPCYLVVALDDTIYDFLHNWLPDHVVRAPPGFTDEVPRQYAAPGTAAMRHLSKARLATLRAINNQGYNVAWSDADIAFDSNVFTVVSRWWDMEATWMDGDDHPLPASDKTVGYELKFSKNDTRKISTSFLYFKGNDNARFLLDKWHNASSVSPDTEDGAVLNQLLRDPAISTKLNIQMLSEANFPTGKIWFERQPEEYKKAWQSQPRAWAHADSAFDKEGKIRLLQNGFWKVVPEDPTPVCPKAYVDYQPNGTAVARWPPAEKLEKIAIDNTVLVTSATCEYADLVSNWVKRVWDLGLSLFFVAAGDESMANFLQDWVPEHTAQMPASMAHGVSGFATRNTSEYTKVVATKPKVMRHILDQGYNVAWSDADAYWLRNPFTLFDRSPDLVVAWSNASELLEGGTYPAGELLGGNQRQITTSFLFVKPSKRTIMLMDAWAASLSSSAYVDDSAALQLLLQRDEYATLNVGVFATPLFPNLGEHTNATSADLKEAWKDEALKPAWVHPDSLLTHDEKVAELKRLDFWLPAKDDPKPTCAASSKSSQGFASKGFGGLLGSKKQAGSQSGQTKSRFWGKRKHKT